MNVEVRYSAILNIKKIQRSDSTLRHSKFLVRYSIFKKQTVLRVVGDWKYKN